MIKIKFEILNKEWTLRVLPGKKFRKRNGKDNVAICYGWKRRIEVNHEVEHENICHELVHAYLTEMCTSTCNKIKKSDLEEMYCELMSKRGRELLDLADTLLFQINKIFEAKVTFVQKVD